MWEGVLAHPLSVLPYDNVPLTTLEDNTVEPAEQADPPQDLGELGIDFSLYAGGVTGWVADMGDYAANDGEAFPIARLAAARTAPVTSALAAVDTYGHPDDETAVAGGSRLVSTYLRNQASLPEAMGRLITRNGWAGARNDWEQPNVRDAADEFAGALQLPMVRLEKMIRATGTDAMASYRPNEVPVLNAPGLDWPPPGARRGLTAPRFNFYVPGNVPDPPQDVDVVSFHIAASGFNTNESTARRYTSARIRKEHKSGVLHVASVKFPEKLVPLWGCVEFAQGVTQAAIRVHDQLGGSGDPPQKIVMRTTGETKKAKQDSPYAWRKEKNRGKAGKAVQQKWDYMVEVHGKTAAGGDVAPLVIGVNHGPNAWKRLAVLLFWLQVAGDNQERKNAARDMAMAARRDDVMHGGPNLRMFYYWPSDDKYKHDWFNPEDAASTPVLNYRGANIIHLVARPEPSPDTDSTGSGRRDPKKIVTHEALRVEDVSPASATCCGAICIVRAIEVAQGAWWDEKRRTAEAACGRRKGSRQAYLERLLLDLRAPVSLITAVKRGPLSVRDLLAICGVLGVEACVVVAAKWVQERAALHSCNWKGAHQFKVVRGGGAGGDVWLTRGGMEAELRAERVLVFSLEDGHYTRVLRVEEVPFCYRTGRKGAPCSAAEALRYHIMEAGGGPDAEMLEEEAWSAYKGQKSDRGPTHLCFWDLETYAGETGELRAYANAWAVTPFKTANLKPGEISDVKEEDVRVVFGRDCIDEMLRELVLEPEEGEEKRRYQFCAFNGGNFDNRLLINAIENTLPRRWRVSSLLIANRCILGMRFGPGGVHSVWDPCRFVTSSLDRACESFGVLPQFSKLPGEISHLEVQAAFDAGTWWEWLEDNRTEMVRYIRRDITSLAHLVHNFRYARIRSCEDACTRTRTRAGRLCWRISAASPASG
jgi:hypothetical protein